MKSIIRSKIRSILVKDCRDKNRLYIETDKLSELQRKSYDEKWEYGSF
jgi:hypothetical protein